MRILSYLRELDEALKDWARYQSISLEELKKDRDKRNMVLYALLEMEADFSHEPNHIPNFLSKISKYEIALGLVT